MRWQGGHRCAGRSECKAGVGCVWVFVWRYFVSYSLAEKNIFFLPSWWFLLETPFLPTCPTPRCFLSLTVMLVTYQQKASHGCWACSASAPWHDWGSLHSYSFTSQGHLFCTLSPACSPQHPPSASPSLWLPASHLSSGSCLGTSNLYHIWPFRTFLKPDLHGFYLSKTLPGLMEGTLAGPRVPSTPHFYLPFYLTEFVANIQRSSDFN